MIDISSFYLVKDFPNYYINTKGQVLSTKRGKPKLNKGGYNYVCFRKDNKQYIKQVHRLVAETFIPNPNIYPMVNHKNCNKRDNNIENLEWCTAKRNSEHASENKLLKPNRGEQCNLSKLTQNDIIYIRTNYKLGDREYGTRGLARKFNVSHGNISLIVNNLTWKDVG